MADAQVHASVADLVTKLHTNIDSIHATLSALTTTSSAHHAELERLSLERETKISELRASHENALKELAVQREKDEAGLLEQRRREQEELEAERQKEYEELMTKRKQEDEEREKALQEKEAERLKALQEEDSKREAERDEMERSLQEKVERELELLEDEMERKVEEGRQALRDLDEKRKAINAEIDAALNTPSVIPPIFFRSRSKTLKGLTNGSNESNGTNSPVQEPVVADMHTIPEVDAGKEDEVTENVETPPSDGMSSVVNGSRDIHIEEEGAPASIPEVLETEDEAPLSVIPVAKHIDISEDTREMGIHEDSTDEITPETHETKETSEGESEQAHTKSEIEHTNEITLDSSHNGPALEPTDSEAHNTLESNAELSKELGDEHTSDAQLEKEIQEEHNLTESKPELSASQSEIEDTYRDSPVTETTIDDKVDDQEQAHISSQDEQSTLEPNPFIDIQVAETPKHHLSQEIETSPEDAVEVSVEKSTGISSLSEQHENDSAEDGVLAVSESRDLDLTQEPISHHHEAAQELDIEESIITKEVSDPSEAVPAHPIPELTSENVEHFVPEPRDLDILEASPEHASLVQEDSNIDQDQDLPSPEAEATEAEHLAHNQPEDLAHSQIEETFENTSDELGLSEDPVEEVEVDRSHQMLSESEDKSLDKTDVLGDEGPVVATDLSPEVESSKQLDGSAHETHYILDEDKTGDSGVPTPKPSIEAHTTSMDNLEELIANAVVTLDGTEGAPREGPIEAERTSSDIPEPINTIHMPSQDKDLPTIDGAIEESESLHKDPAEESEEAPKEEMRGVSHDIEISEHAKDHIETLSKEINETGLGKEDLIIGSHGTEGGEDNTHDEQQATHILETKLPISASSDIDEGGSIYDEFPHSDTEGSAGDKAIGDDLSSSTTKAEHFSPPVNETLPIDHHEIHASKEKFDGRGSSTIEEDLKPYESASEADPSVHSIEHNPINEDDAREISTDDDFESALSDGGSVSPKYEPSTEDHLSHSIHSLHSSEHLEDANGMAKDLVGTEESHTQHSDVSTISTRDIELSDDKDSNISKEHLVNRDSTAEDQSVELPSKIVEDQAEHEAFVHEDSEETTPRLESFSVKSTANGELEHDEEPIPANGNLVMEDTTHLSQEVDVKSAHGDDSTEDSSKVGVPHHEVNLEDIIHDEPSHSERLEPDVFHEAKELEPESSSRKESGHEESHMDQSPPAAEAAHSSDIQLHHGSTDTDLELPATILSTTEGHGGGNVETESKDISSHQETPKLEGKAMLHEDVTSTTATEQSRDIDLGDKAQSEEIPGQPLPLEDDVSQADVQDTHTHQEGVRLSAPSSRETLTAHASSHDAKVDQETVAIVDEQKLDATPDGSTAIDVFKYLDPEENETPEVEAAYDTMDEGSLKDGAPLNGSTGPLDHSADRENTLTPDLHQAVVGSHVNRFAESPATVLHTDDETDDTDSDTSEISEEEESGADAEDEEEESEEDEETYDSDGSDSEEEESDDPVPVPMPSKIERNFPHVIQAMPSYEFGKPKMLDPFSEGSIEQIDFSSSRSSGLYSSLVDTIKSDPVVKQMGNNGGSRSPHLEDEYPPPAEVTDAMKAKRLVQNAFQKTDTEDDAPFHDSFSDHQPSNTHSRSHTADTVPLFESHTQSDADSTASETPSSPFQENPRDEPMIASLGPLHEQVSEDIRDLKADASPLRAEFDPYGSNTYPKYITSKQSQANLKSPIKSPRSPRNDRFVSQSIISPKSQYSPRGTPSPTSRRFSQSSNAERPYSPEARSLSYREKRPSQDPLPSPTLKRSMTDKQLPSRPPFTSPSVPPVPANSFFQKTRSLFEATAQATQALPTVTRPLSGYFNGRGSPSPSPSPTPRLQKKGSMASLRSRPSSLYQSELPVEEEDLVPRSLDGDGKPPSPAWSIPTAASAARSGSVSSQRSQGGRKGSHGSINRVENDLNVWTPSKDIRPRSNNPFGSAMGRGVERERVPLLAGEGEGPDGGVGVGR